MFRNSNGFRSVYFQELFLELLGNCSWILSTSHISVYPSATGLTAIVLTAISGVLTSFLTAVFISVSAN
jgi:hypothetical protein